VVVWPELGHGRHSRVTCPAAGFSLLHDTERSYDWRRTVTATGPSAEGRLRIRTVESRHWPRRCC